jgi:hypothetical protein
MIELGKYNTLAIDHRADQGLYLKGDEQTGDILLPIRYVTSQMQIGDEVEVFIYLDQDERLVATTEHPLATVGQFAYLRVAWTNKYGAFLNWGLMKDLFCPFREQKQPMQRGKGYIVYVKEDEQTHRLMATAKVERYLSVPYSETEPQPSARPPVPLLKHGDAVDCLIWQKTDLGFKAIVTPSSPNSPSLPSSPSSPTPYYQGQLYDNQIFRPLHTGDRVTAYVDHVRQDGKIDLTLQPTGHRHTLDFAETLLRYLYENDGHCELGDKSDAELVYDRFKVSKKAYKKAIGDLYRRHLIIIEEDGSIRLVS